MDANMPRMDVRQKRQAWIRSIIEREFNGAIGKFARAIEREPSYVSRMLYPEGKSGAKGIGEEMVDYIASKFGPPPAGAEVAAKAKSGTSVQEQRERDIEAQNMVNRSLVHALSKNVPGAAPAFADHLRRQARAHTPKPFATDFGLLGEVLGIASRGRSSAEDGDPLAKRRDSAKTSR